MAALGDDLDELTVREKANWRVMKKALEALGFLIGKMKTEGVKGNVERLNRAYSKIAKCKTKLHAKYKVRINLAENELLTGQNKVAGLVNELEDKMMAVLDRMAVKIDDQDKALEQLAARPPLLMSAEPESGPLPGTTEPKWTEVVRKPAKGPSAAKGDVETGKTDTKLSTRKVR